MREKTGDNLKAFKTINPLCPSNLSSLLICFFKLLFRDAPLLDYPFRPVFILTIEYVAENVDSRKDKKLDRVLLDAGIFNVSSDKLRKRCLSFIAFIQIFHYALHTRDHTIFIEITYRIEKEIVIIVRNYVTLKFVCVCV